MITKISVEHQFTAPRDNTLEQLVTIESQRAIDTEEGQAVATEGQAAAVETTILYILSFQAY